MRPQFEAPTLATETPALPGVQLRAWNKAASVERRAANVTGRLVAGRIPYGEIVGTVDGFGELLKPGCFAASIAADDPRVLANCPSNPEALPEIHNSFANSMLMASLFRAMQTDLSFPCSLTETIQDPL